MSKIMDVLDWSEIDADEFVKNEVGEILFELDRIINRIGYKKTYKLLDHISLHINKEDPLDIHNSLLNYDEILRAIEREHMLKMDRKSRKGRHYMSKVKDFAISYKNSVEHPGIGFKTPEDIEKLAKEKLSRTSFWRFKKMIEKYKN